MLHPSMLVPLPAPTVASSPCCHSLPQLEVRGEHVGEVRGSPRGGGDREKGLGQERLGERRGQQVELDRSRGREGVMVEVRPDIKGVLGKAPALKNSFRAADLRISTVEQFHRGFEIPKSIW